MAILSDNTRILGIAILTALSIVLVYVVPAASVYVNLTLAVGIIAIRTVLATTKKGLPKKMQCWC